ncbi:TonB-dependent receptor [Phaeodactylibacter luteus]|uniref:TonB-dependent receptor n=1 Tax=Phaeodactylibacter luteus TaxID=1564516 RepID=A0A5C6RJQ5_9BACT|nr:TonB-dependent receptor [Phaeodactylibacter luteus]TXB61562.1 TonB-dependent receptor [Phaeodactylibacter luteus]
MRLKLPIIALLALLSLGGLIHPLAAQPVQTLKGSVVDQQSEIPIIGATVELLGGAEATGGVTDLDGRFQMEGVPVGRHSVRISYLGYETVTVPNILVTAGKQAVLNVSLQESVLQMDEVVVTAKVGKGQPQNEMATISVRSFNPEEVNRFSGGRNDVARLAGSFAGVAVADDSRNDIVIRGNSPTGVLWRLNGIPIPNPNHFATLGTTGGPVSALNPNLLKTSDFLTSAFPAEYGNALGGVFDLGFRPGNRDEHEFMFQLAAFSGLEAMAEGPLNDQHKGAYLVSYRHSFVEVADYFGIPVGTNATPNYRDLSFNLDFGNGKAGKFTLFGIGAMSNIDFLGNEIDETDLFANPDEDAYATSQMGIAGLRHNLIVGENAYLRTVASVSTARSGYEQDNYLAEEGQKIRVTEVADVTNTFSLSSFLNKKFNRRLTARMGLLAEHYQLDTQVDDREGRPDLDGDGAPDWFRVRDFDGGMTLLQAYAQGVYRFTDELSLQAGLHGQWLIYNNTRALEPRLAINWQLHPRHRLNLGYGLHHQMQPLPVFFFTENDPQTGALLRSNENLDFTQSSHWVLGYDWNVAPSWKARAEVYYQAIADVPVQPFPSSFSMLNAGADFVFPEAGRLVNEGAGANYGLELTVEKFFSQGYYGLLTASFFDSKYEGSDKVRRNTAFNNGYVVNFLAGKEFKIGKDKRNALTFDMRASRAGGRYYTPVDLAASQEAGEEVLDEAKAFSERYDPYFRLDLKFGYQLNSKNKRLSQQFFIDLQNITAHENIFDLRYNPQTQQINKVLQSGFFPDIMYRLQF